MIDRQMVSAIAIGAALFVPGVAYAQGDAPGSVADNAALAQEVQVSEGEIVVTARRRDERLVDAPVAITAVSGEMLNDYAATKMTDITGLVPSLIAGRASSGSSASIFLRGVGSTSLNAGFDQSVSFVVDGMAMSRGREINLTQYDLAQIEVLKGPQALFFGKNTTGGLINITTRGPTDHFEAGGKAGYGFKAREYYGEAYVSGPITEGLRARLAFRGSDSDGPFKNTAAATYTDPHGFDIVRDSSRRGGGRTLSGRLSVDWDAAPNLTFALKTGYTDQKDNSSSDLIERICGGGRTTPFDASGIPHSPNADCRINGRSDGAGVPAEVAAADYRWARDGQPYGSLKSGFAILNSRIESDVFDVTSITAYYRFKSKDLNNVAGEGYPASFTQLADYRQFSEELRFQTKFDGPVNAMFGVYYVDNKFIFNTDAYFIPLPLDPATGTYVAFKRDNGFKGQTMSGFAELTWNLTDQIELSGGVRYSWESRNSFQQALQANSFVAGIFPPDLRLEDRFRDDNLSPQATLRYKPNRDLTIYASYKQGFKSGGYNISQTLTAAANVAAGQYGSEKAKGGELGVKSILMGGALSLNATIYSYDYTDLQVQTFDPVTIGLIVGNAGKLRTRGIEGDFNWDVGSGFSLRGTAAYNDAEYKNYVGECYGGQTVAAGCSELLNSGTGNFSGQDFGGRTPPKAPKFAGRAGASYETAFTNDWSVSLSGDLSYSSKFNYTDTLRPDGWQDDYVKIDAAIRLKGPDDRWSIGLIGRNLTNELTVTSATDIPFAGGTGTGTTGTGVLADMSAYVDNPREFYVEVGFKF